MNSQLQIQKYEYKNHYYFYTLATNTWKMKLKETILSCPAMIGTGIGGPRVPGASRRGLPTPSVVEVEQGSTKAEGVDSS